MTQAIIRTAEQEEYSPADNTLFFLRDVVTAKINPQLSLHRGRIEPGGEICCSRDQMETIYILSGDVLCTMGGQETTLGAGHCIVVSPDVDRSLKNSGEQPVELLIAVTPPRC
ncbi:MAG: cupin domain-containing protein [Desulfuromonas sp.]|nr:cupin domain-containing protein [Desulfuromonas sp.]